MPPQPASVPLPSGGGSGRPLPQGERRFPPSPGGAFGTAGLSRGGQRRPYVSFPRKRESSCFFLDCRLRRKDTVAPSPGGAFGTAGLSRGGERRAGFLLTQEGHGGGCKEAWTAACAGMTPAGFPLSGEGHGAPSSPGLAEANRLLEGQGRGDGLHYG